MDERRTRGAETPRRKNVLTGQNKASGEVTPRRRPVYPYTAERENMRAALRFTELVIRASDGAIRSVMRQYPETEDYRADDAGDFMTTLRGMRYAAAEKLSQKRGAMRELEKQAMRSGGLAKTHSINDWGLQVEDALGITIQKEYYDDGIQRMVDEWVHENVSKIGSIPAEYLGEVESIIRWGYDTKQPKVNVYRRLEKLAGMTRTKAKMIARDQLGTLNARMTQFEHESAGVTKYKWVTRRDSLVRDCHRELNGTIHKWSEPPPMWYMTKSRGIVYTGRYCNPGEDYGCRCTASPVFEMESALKALRDKFRPISV